MIVAQSITLVIILILMIPTLYFVIRKANNRRGFGPAISIGIGITFIVINSLYELITTHSMISLQILSIIGAICILFGVAWNASVDIKFMNGVKYCVWPCCPNCCKYCQKYQRIDDYQSEI
eukprot:56588_1